MWLALPGCGESAVVVDAGPVDPLGLHDWADAVVRSSGSRWVGERLPEHDPEARPDDALRAESSRFALSVHAPDGVSNEQVAQVADQTPQELWSALDVAWERQLTDEEEAWLSRVPWSQIPIRCCFTRRETVACRNERRRCSRPWS